MRRCKKKPEMNENITEMIYVKSLGKGSYGSVDLFSCKQHDGSTLYNAVKISDSQGYDFLDREFRILSELKECPRIVRVYGNTLLKVIDYKGEKVYKIVMEYAAGGTLTSYIERNRKLSDSVIKDFTRMILQGVVSLHSRGYVHCDLKPDNLLLFPRYDEETWNCSYELKISDFGLTIKTKGRSDCWAKDSPFVGTPLYMSPESVQDGTSVEQTLDLWSLGCIVLVMYTCKHPWTGLGLDEIKNLLINGKGPEIPETVPCDARQFLEKCFARKPKERGSATELLLHPFLIGEHSGERRRLLLRIRKPPERYEDIAKKPLKLKVILSKSSQFKRISDKPRKVKILHPRPPRSNFVPVQ